MALFPTMMSWTRLMGIGLMLSTGLTWASEFYVATDSSDSNPGTKEKPFATLLRAREAVRAARKTDPAPVTVWVRGGTYYLDKPLVFGAEDSGAAQAPILYAAWPAEPVVLSGGRALTGWKPYRDQIWQCDLKAAGLKGLSFRELFYNGRRQPLARVPNFDPKHPRTGGFLYVAEGGQRGSKRLLKYPPAKLDPSRWAHPAQAEVDVFPYHNWDNNVIGITEIDPLKHIITLSKDANYELIWDTRFYVRNVFEELNAPGEWYLDPESDTLYFWPPDDRLLQGNVMAPALDTLIELKGDRANQAPVRYLEFRGFSLQVCRGPAVRFLAADHCALTRSSVINIGYSGDAVLLNSANDNRVIGNDIAEAGMGGVRVHGKGNLVSNNHIHHIGVILRTCPAISVAGQANVVSHNLIHDVPNRGIDFTGHDNIMEYNEIHHFGLETNVPGGIYAYAKDHPEVISGTIIRFNKISDAVGYGMMSFGKRVGEWGPNQGIGVWLDDMVSNTTIYGNIFIRNRAGGVVIHGGASNVVENNILGAGISGDINHLRPNHDPCHNRIRRNIVYYPNSDPHMQWLYGWTQEAEAKAARGDAIPVFLCGWSFVDSAVAESDYNLMFPIRGKTVETLYCFRGAAPSLTTGPWVDAPVADRFAWWRRFGFEAHSQVADPLFVDAAHDDFRLLPESPAVKLGFKPIPIDKIGLEQSPDRVTWPVDNQQGIWREQPETFP